MAHRNVIRSPSRFAGKPRRETVWFQFTPAASSLATTGSAIFFTLNAAALALRPFTVVRSHFLFSQRSDQLAVTEVSFVGYGIAVVSDQASAIGVTAVPTPITDLGSDLWLLHAMNFTDFIFSSAVGFEEHEAQNLRVDSKAMRKVDVGQDLVVVAESSSLSTDAKIVVMGGRMLVKLH